MKLASSAASTLLKKTLVAGATAAVVTTVAITTMSVVSGGSMSGTMVVNEDAPYALTTSASIDSTVTNASQIRVGFPIDRVVGGGNSHMIGMSSDGSVFGWGWTYGLATGSFTFTPYGVQIGTGSQWATATAGMNGSALIRSDGALYTTGYNGNGECGDGTTLQRPTLVPVSGAGSWRDVAFGSSHMLGVQSDGSLWAWGNNGYGQLGQGYAGANILVPTRVGTANDWVDVEAGQLSSFALKADGTLWSWGYNSNGVLGIGNTANQYLPVQVTPGQTYTSIQVSDSNVFLAYAIRSDGTLWGWGGSPYGVGNGTTVAQYTPVRVLPTTTVKEISCQAGHALAVAQDGSLWSWGDGTNGELGNVTSSTVPVQVGTDVGWSNVFAGMGASFGTLNGTLYSWGYYYVNGQNDSLNASVPTTLTSAWLPYQPHIGWELGSNDGTQTVWASYKDAAATSITASDTILVDLTPPVGSMTVNGDAPTSNSTTVTICSASMGGAADMSVESGAWVPYSPVLNAKISNSEGNRVVSVRYRDIYGRTTEATDAIIIDTVAPSGTFSLNSGQATTRFTRVIGNSATDATNIRPLDLPGFSKVVTNGSTTVGLRADGTIWACGNNSGYQLADGTITTRYSFVKCADIGQTWRDVALGQGMVIAVAADGTLWGWGSPSYGWGDVGPTNRPTPSRIDANTDWWKVYGGPYTCAGLRTNGALYMWGYNADGQIGDGTQTNRSVMARIGSTNFKDVSCNLWSTMAVGVDGSLWGWGYNGTGLLGLGNTTPQRTPVRIGTANNWAAVGVMANSSVALKADGTLWTCGDNFAGQLGDGSTTGRATFAQVGTATTWKSISAGSNGLLATRTDGSLWAWGFNSDGQVGDGSKVNRTTPFRVGSENDWKSISSANQTSLALKSDGSLWGWGYNGWGILGDGSATNRVLPTRGDFDAYSASYPLVLPVGDGTKTAAMLYRDAAGNVGTLVDDIVLDTMSSPGSVSVNGGAAFATSPNVTLTASVPWATEMRVAAPVRSVALGDNQLIYLGDDGVLTGSGSSYTGALGTGSAVQYSTPVTAFSARRWTGVDSGQAHTLAIKDGTQLWASGFNTYGQVGDGTTANAISPVLLAGSWQQASAGGLDSAGVQADGSLWTWGNNGMGQLGVGDYAQRNVPTRVDATTTWKSVFVGPNYNMFGIRTDGSLWAWGMNNYGQLGVNDVATKLVPTQVGTAYDWVAIAPGVSHTLGLKVDGSLWAWGRNNNFQVTPDTTYPQLLVPTKIGYGFGAVAAGNEFSLARKSDGTLWGWGVNTFGQLGTGDQFARRWATRIGSDADWIGVDAASGLGVGVKTDGTVWGWGNDGSSYLGLGGYATRTSPVIIGPAWGPYATAKNLTIPFADGPVKVYSAFRDIAGNAMSLYDDILCDFGAPVTTASGVPSGWATAAPVSVSLSATDTWSPIQQIRASVGGAPAQAYVNPILFSADGTATLSFSSVDSIGNVEATKTATIRIDTVKPATTCSTDGSWSPNGSVSLLGTDSTSGISNTYYRLDGSLTTTYTSALSLADGVHTLDYWSVDVAGNVESTWSVSPRIDRVKPTSSSNVLPSGWVSNDTTVALSASDDRSGVAGIRYRLDGSVPATYSADLTIRDGSHTLEWWAVDNAGNEEAHHVQTVKVDTTPPITLSNADGVWRRVPQTVTLAETDTNSGIASTFYRLRGGPVTPYLGPVFVAEEGESSFEYWSADMMGNVQLYQTAYVRNDFTNPVTTVLGVPSSEATQEVMLTLTATDTASGVSNTYYRLNGGTNRLYPSGQTGLPIVTEGTTTVDVWSVDTAGNAETPQHFSIRIKYASEVSPTSKSPACLECHSGGTGPRRVRLDFSVGDVDRASACPKCHVPSFAGTHPYHNPEANCGAICHWGWGASLITAVPSVTTSYGAFAANSSKDLSSDVLHVIHANPRWEKDVDRTDSRCSSCHAAAACQSCHSDPNDGVDYTHRIHSACGDALYPARPAVSRVVGYGVPAGNQTVLTAVGETEQCGTAECHNLASMKPTDPVTHEDYAIAGGGSQPANLISVMGAWRTAYASVYSAGRMQFGTAGSTLTHTFSGQRVAFVAPTGSSWGMAEILVDGVPTATVDCFSASTRQRVEIWRGGDMPAGIHTITIRVLGDKNPASTGTLVPVDGFPVWEALPGKIASKCTDTCHPDRVATHGYTTTDHVADVGASIEPLSGARCDACHSMDLLTEHERQGSSPKGKSCLTCHGSPRKSFGVWNQTCTQGGCHTPLSEVAMHGELPGAHAVSVVGRDNCTRNCHKDTMPSAHVLAGAPESSTCVWCHNSVKYEASIRTASWTYQCSQCHTANHMPQAKAGNGLCFDCHGSSDTTITLVGGLGAYVATAGDHEAGYAASAHGTKVPAGNNGGVETGIQCEACHNHNSISAANPTRLRIAGPALVREQMCFTCHSRSGAETRTPTPNTWNGRDIAEEFARPSTHPIGLSVAMSRLETTRTAFAQYRQAEFAVDGLFQATAVSPTGSSLLWGSYLESPAPGLRLYLQPGWSNRLVQYDPARDKWDTDRYLPPNAPFTSGYTGANSAFTLGNKVYFAANSARAVYSPADGAVNGVWTSLTNLPDFPSPNADVALDTTRGVAYYSGHGGNYFKLDVVTDTMAVVNMQDTAGNVLSLWNEAALAYVPEFDRLFVLSNNGWMSPIDGHLLYVDSPSTKGGTAVFTDTGVPGARPAVQPYGFNRLKRFSRSGHDYLAFVGYDPSGALVTQVWSGLGASAPTTRTVAAYPFANTYNTSVEWDGGDYLYASRQGTDFARIKIPADPVNGVWGTWEQLTPSPNGGSGGSFGFAVATPTPYTVNGYYRAGTISADVELSPSARGWDSVEWQTAVPVGTAVSLSVKGWDGSAWSDLPGYQDLLGSSKDLSAISASTYRKLRFVAKLSSTIDGTTPSLRQWVVSERVSLGDERNVASLACASCHSAHTVGDGGSSAWNPQRVSDPLNTKRTVASTTDFCLRCHSIYGTNSARGATDLAPYVISFTAPGGLFTGWDKGSTQFGFKTSGHFTTSGTKALCETCHDPHGSNNARLLAWTRPSTFTTGTEGTRDNTSTAAAEENLCLQCHGNGVNGRQAPGAADIATSIYSRFGHNVAISGAHSDTETLGSLQTNRHAECVDCHDPHAAKAGTHTQGLAVGGDVLRGAIGVKPTWPSTPMSTPTTLTPVRMGSRGDEPEAYLCLKCHSGTGGLPASERRADGSTYTPTDVAAEFNPNNASFHNVLGVGGMKTVFNVGGVDYFWSRPADSQYLKPGWTADSQVTCSDCHTSGSMTAAKGPHGSSVEFMIDPAYPADYSYASLDFREVDGVWPSGQLICTKCHVFNRTQNVAHGTSTLILGPTPVHTREYGAEMRCTSCHVGIPHGWKRPRLLGYGGDPSPYRTQSGPYRGQLDAISLRNHAPGDWNMGDCNGCGIWAHNYGLTRWP